MLVIFETGFHCVTQVNLQKFLLPQPPRCWCHLCATHTHLENVNSQFWQYLELVIYSIYCHKYFGNFFFSWQLYEVHTICYVFYRWGDWGSSQVTEWFTRLGPSTPNSAFLFSSFLWCWGTEQGHLVLGMCSTAELHPQPVFLTTH